MKVNIDAIPQGAIVLPRGTRQIVRAILTDERGRVLLFCRKAADTQTQICYTLAGGRVMIHEPQPIALKRLINSQLNVEISGISLFQSWRHTRRKRPPVWHIYYYICRVEGEVRPKELRMRKLAATQLRSVRLKVGQESVLTDYFASI